MRHNSLHIFFALLFFIKTPCLAINDPPVSYLGIEHGLSNNMVTSIYQDHNGFIWIGTYDGLNRYDGYTFKIFRNILTDTTSLSNNQIRAIGEDGNHHLWIGTGKGINIYDPVTADFKHATFKSWNKNVWQPLESYIRDIQKTNKRGFMLVGTLSAGLIVFEKNNYAGVQIPLVSPKGHEGNYDATAIAFDSSLQIAWVFVRHVGLCRFNLKSKTLQLVNTSVKKISCLKLDSKGNLWMGNEDGLFRYDIHNNTFSPNVMPFTLRVIRLCEDSQRVLWIATDGGGLWSMANGNPPVPFVSGAGIPLVNSNTVNAIYVDVQGNKWVGTLRGGINLIQHRNKPFKHITAGTAGNKNTANDFISAFAEDKKGNLWIGTNGAGLRYWHRQHNSFTTYKHDPGNPGSISSDFVSGMQVDSAGDLWFASWFGGISRLRKGSQKFEHYECYNPYTGNIENNAWVVYEDAEKRLLVGFTNNGTLYHFDRNANRFDVIDPGLKHIQSISEDEKGVLWIGSNTLLIALDLANKNKRQFDLGAGVWSMHADRNKNFWVGTDGGGLLLFNRSTGTFQRFSTSDGLPSNTILRIHEDNKNNLWLSTYNGLCRFNTIDKTCRNFTPSDGLQSSQFNFNASLGLRSGELCFGGIKGFNIFYPDSIYEKKEALKTFLTGLNINNKPVEEQLSYVKKRSAEWIEKIEIPFDLAVLSLDYVALNFTAADKIQYAYKLDGWDKHWNYVKNSRTANYSRLQEGFYTFKLKVSTGAGEWGDGVSLLTISVLPPWYRTWWAYTVYAVLLASGFYLYIVYYRRQDRLRYQIKLANLEKEKEKELTEKKLSFFTHISHEFRTPLTLIINPAKDLLQKSDTPDENKELNIIHRNARRLLTLVDQLLLFRKADAEADNMKFSRCNFYDLCYEVYLCFLQQAKMNNLEYLFECENKKLELYVDREKIEIALFNLLSNAIKYTPAGGCITFRVREKETEVEVAVCDNGYGIPKQAASRLFEKFYQATSDKAPGKTGFGIGLYLVKHFVEGHKGEVSFQSEEGVGSTFVISLKKGRQHLEGQAIRELSQKEPAILEELTEEPPIEFTCGPGNDKEEQLISDRKTLLLVDDDDSIRKYLRQILERNYEILEAVNGQEALALARDKFPDLIISDFHMEVMDGIELCRQIKKDESLNHIPVMLLTGDKADEVELKSIEGGADVYITKPFDKDILIARVENLFKRRTQLQEYFFNEITLKKNTLKISPEYKEFLDRCIAVVEEFIDDDQFTIAKFADEMRMSHSYLYKKVREISGQSIIGLIRFIRLRKAAELMIKGNYNVNQAAYLVGISDVKYFRVQFNKLFGMNPSEYRKKYREPFNKSYQISSKVMKDKPKK